MLGNYFKIGIRNALQHKNFSLINIVGLAAGLTCCLFILLYIRDELSFDRYNKHADRIYRISSHDWARMPPAVGPALVNDYPQLAEQAVRIWPVFAPTKIRQGAVVFVETAIGFCDASVFQVFTWPLVVGDPNTALKDPNSIVISESMAKKYFGDQDPMGKTLNLWGDDLSVSGIMKDLPENSHLRLNFLVSIPVLSRVMGNNFGDRWDLPVFFTYVLTPSGVGIQDLVSATSQLLSKHQVDASVVPVAQPLTTIHLDSHLDGDFAAGGNRSYLYILAVAGIFVLLLACVNFINLTTARAATRTKEVGMRKVMGALRLQLIAQFFGESLLMCGAAFIVSLFIVQAVLPVFNQISGKEILVADLLNFKLIFSALLVVLAVAIIGGGYPALVLSGFRPVKVLKGEGGLRGSNSFLRKGLVVFQFAVSTALSIGMVVVYSQLNYIQNKDLGFDREHVMVLDGDRFPMIRDALSRLPDVVHVAGVPTVIGGPLPSSPFQAEGITFDSTRLMNDYGVTPGFIQTMDIHLVAGRSFREGSEMDADEGFILNESAARSLGWSAKEAIGKSFSMRVPPMDGGREVWRKGQVIGVVQDFNYDALYSRIAPLALYPSRDMNLTLVRLRKIDHDAIAAVGNVWKQINPDAPYNYYFLEEHIDQEYRSESRLAGIMGIATGLALLIACLGLFGLAAFTAARRTKEIGIRKVFGATVHQINRLLSGEFIRLVGLGSIIAVPLAWYGMHQWLNNFAYHIQLSWAIFSSAVAGSFVIALITVSYQSIRAALKDPVETMRYE